MTILSKVFTSERSDLDIYQETSIQVDERIQFSKLVLDLHGRLTQTVKKPNCGSPLSSQAFNIQLSLTSSSQHSLVSYPAVNPLSPVSSSYIHKHDFRSQNLTNSKRRMLMQGTNIIQALIYLNHLSSSQSASCPFLYTVQF